MAPAARAYKEGTITDASIFSQATLSPTWPVPVVPLPDRNVRESWRTSRVTKLGRLGRLGRSLIAASPMSLPPALASLPLRVGSQLLLPLEPLEKAL